MICADARVERALLRRRYAVKRGGDKSGALLIICYGVDARYVADTRCYVVAAE